MKERHAALLGYIITQKASEDFLCHTTCVNKKKSAKAFSYIPVRPAVMSIVSGVTEIFRSTYTA